MSTRMTWLRVKHYVKWTSVFAWKRYIEIFERCRIGDKYIHCFVRWPINKLVDNKYEMLRVKEKFTDPPKEMVI
jgi:hypothetical protein